MSIAAVVIGLSPAKDRSSRGRGRAKDQLNMTAMAGLCRGALAGAAGETLAVISDEAVLEVLPEGLSVLLDTSGLGEAGALRAAIDFAARAGHEALVVAVLGQQHLPQVLFDAASWHAMIQTSKGPIVLGTSGSRRVGLCRLTADVWPLVPLEGSLAPLFDGRLAQVIELPLEPAVSAPAHGEAASGTTRVLGTQGPQASPAEEQAVGELLGRRPQGAFKVAVRDGKGAPLVIENAPFLDDGTPMPTRYWLVGKQASEAVSRLESAGGVKAAEAAVPPDELALTHHRYAAERDALIDPGHVGPRPSGGVGGTRQGVKCLHAHLAFYLAGGADPVGRWVCAQIGHELWGAVAAIDCGTNSTRLLVLGPDHGVLAREMTITRLGEGVDATGSLSSDAITRTIDALTRYRSICDHFAVVALRATATSAARDAANSEEFFDRAESVLGVRPELIKGAEEGRLSYRGATAGLSGGPYLVVDLGGGSTELIAGSEDGQIAAVTSLDIGCVRVTERFFTGDPPSPDSLLAARAYVRNVLEEALVKLPDLLVPKEMIGVAGTVSTLTSLALGLSEYDSTAIHHANLERAQVISLLEMLAAMDVETRRSYPGIEHGRADVIVGGALVLDEVMRATGHDILVHSESDILDGVAAELLDNKP